MNGKEFKKLLINRQILLQDTCSRCHKSLGLATKVLNQVVYYCKKCSDELNIKSKPVVQVVIDTKVFNYQTRSYESA